jgi:hypothetical protein
MIRDQRHFVGKLELQAELFGVSNGDSSQRLIYAILERASTLSSV